MKKQSERTILGSAPVSLLSLSHYERSTALSSSSLEQRSGSRNSMPLVQLSLCPHLASVALFQAALGQCAALLYPGCTWSLHLQWVRLSDIRWLPGHSLYRERMGKRRGKHVLCGVGSGGEGRKGALFSLGFIFWG